MTALFRLLALLLIVTVPQAVVASAATCSGTTEERLQCHAPEVKAFLRDWVRAWGDGDIETYLAMYTSIRSPREDMTRDDGEENRRARISPDRRIEINLKLESMGLEDSGIFDVVFTQQYISDTYQDEVRKRLFLVRESGELRIWKEEVI